MFKAGWRSSFDVGSVYPSYFQYPFCSSIMRGCIIGRSPRRGRVAGISCIHRRTRL